MIIAFSPEQAYEVSQAFNAPWFMNDALYADFLNNDEDPTKKASNDSKKSKEKGSPTSPTTTAPVDSKPSAKATTQNCKKACRPNNKANTTTFRPCFRYNNLAARCNRQRQVHRQQQHSASSTTNKRTIDQKTPIHLHEETPDAAKMSLDITGFTPQDVTITVEDHVVFVKGQRTNRLGDVFVLDRKFRLDKKTALVEEVTATFDNDGILEITVPKKSLAGPRTIPIVVASSSGSSDESASELESQEGKTDEDTSVSVSQEDNNSAVNEPTPQEVEDPQSLEGTSHSSQRRGTHIELTAVKTVQEIETNQDEEDDENESQSIASATYTTSNKSTEDEAWEEVSK